MDVAPHWRLWITSGCIVVAAIFAWLPISDSVGSEYVDSAFQRALVGFALARGLNGVISVAQGTELAVQPAGVGVNFTPGEILDPVNDLVERFSWIMMLATSSLGIQKILLSMSAWQGLLVALLVTGGLLLLSLWWRADQRVREVLSRVFLLLLLLRFMMPCVSIANEWVYRTFLQQDYVQATAALGEARVQIGDINEEVLEHHQSAAEPGWMDRARDAYRQLMASVDIEKRLQEYAVAAESISENTIRLVVVFLMQTLVFPLLFLWIVYSLMKRLTR